MMLDPRDRALQSTCPVLAVPCFGTLPDMQNGQRVVVATNGVFVQVKLDWLDCMLCVAALPSSPSLPYGAMRERIAFSFGLIPVRLLESFIEIGRARLPDEVAGGLIYSHRTGKLRLNVFDPWQASEGRIDYRMPHLAEDETIAVDLHTHGRSPAFWSPLDDRDDRGIKVAGVFGHLQHATPSAALRLAVNGCYRALRHPWEAAALSGEGLDGVQPGRYWTDGVWGESEHGTRD